MCPVLKTRRRASATHGSAMTPGVCTCLDNGHVSADCPPAPGAQNVVTATSSVEEVLVKGAFVVVLLFMMCFTALCFFMFRANKGRRSRKEVLQEVNDIQEEEREGP